MKRIADDSFTAVLPDDFGTLPLAEIFCANRETAIALSLKCVKPHTDDWLASASQPKARAALFWLVSIPNGETLDLQVGNSFCTLGAGECVIFDDSLVHSVISDRKWIGCAVQGKILANE